MSIYRSSVNHPVTTALVFIAFMIFGIFSLVKTSIAQLPEFDANTIMVMSSYPGASAADIENNLTKVLENSLNGVSDLKSLTSTSRENTSLLTLEFRYGIDIDEATNNVRDKLDMVNSSLPDGVTVPVIFKFSADDMPIMILSATADESLPGLDNPYPEPLRARSRSIAIPRSSRLTACPSARYPLSSQPRTAISLPEASTSVRMSIRCACRRSSPIRVNSWTSSWAP